MGRKPYPDEISFCKVNKILHLRKAVQSYRESSICFKSMESQLLYQIALTMAKGVGTHTIKHLLSTLGDEASVFQCSPQELESIPHIGTILSHNLLDPEVLKRAEKELSFLEKIGGEAIAFTDSRYPQRMKDCADAPYVIYTKGEMDLNPQRTIGIVGTRKMTNYGKSICEEIIYRLSEKHPDIQIISGLAHGVDGCAHKKAVEVGISTIGVVGHGLETIYPATHRLLAEKMFQKGGIITEYHSNCIVNRKNFVSRNRIIAAMCDVTLVVESGEKGGALFTAEFANSYNRDVCAIPGRVGDPYSIGCNQLIKNNQAAMVECAEDIERLMNWDVNITTKPNMPLTQFMGLSDREKIIVEALQLEDRMDMNQLVRKTQIPFGELSSLLFDLEMKEIVHNAPGNLYFLSPCR